MSTPTLDQPVHRGPGSPPPPVDPRRRRRLVAGVLAAIAIVALAIAAVVIADDDDVAQQTGASSTTNAEPADGSSTTAPSSTTTTASTVPVETADATVMWPFPGSSTRFATPEEAARSFGTEFLRFQEPVVGTFRPGDSRSGEVPLQPSATGPETTVLVRQIGPGDDWSVLGAVTADIEVTEPAAFAEITSPVRVTGRALAFEGNVQVEVRADGDVGAIGAGFVTGGGDELRPFQGVVAFETPGAPYGSLVLFSESGEDGRVWQAAAMRVAFRSTDADAAACGGFRSPRSDPGPGQMEVEHYAACDLDDGTMRPVYRLVERTPRVLRATLESLLAGLTADEQGASLRSWFSAETEGMLRSVTVEDGHAVVDFGDLRSVIPNASSSAGSAQLLAQLDATVFQFRSVESVEYRIEGSCEAFTEWLQFGGCEARTRPDSAD